MNNKSHILNIVSFITSILFLSLLSACGDSYVCARTGFYECNKVNLLIEVDRPLCDLVLFPPPNSGSIKPITVDSVERRWFIIGFNVVSDICYWVKPLDPIEEKDIDISKARDGGGISKDSLNIIEEASASVAPESPGPKLKAVELIPGKHK